VKYYENIRLVYEIESRVRDLKRATSNDNGGENQQPKQEQKQAPKDEKQNNTNREPEQKYQNYSRDTDNVVLVALDKGLSDPGRQREEA
jgi:hypothetical protein